MNPITPYDVAALIVGIPCILGALFVLYMLTFGGAR